MIVQVFEYVTVVYQGNRVVRTWNAGKNVVLKESAPALHDWSQVVFVDVYPGFRKHEKRGMAPDVKSCVIQSGSPPLICAPL